MWTTEQIGDLVDLNRQEQYAEKYKNRVHEIDKFYEQVAALKNLVRETGWDMTYGFQKKYFAFYVEQPRRRRVFGVNVEGPPRFCVWITEGKAEELNEHCKIERYPSGKTFALYPVDTKIEDLRPILEAAYKKHSENDS